MNGLRKVRSTSRLFLLFSNSQVEKCLSNHLIEPVELNVIVKRRLNLEKSDLPLIEVEGNLELFKVWICLISVFNFADILNTVLCREREQCLLQGAIKFKHLRSSSVVMDQRARTKSTTFTFFHRNVYEEYPVLLNFYCSEHLQLHFHVSKTACRLTVEIFFGCICFS